MEILTFLADGLLIGFVYGIAAMGLTLIWGVMNVINLSHGSLIALGMFGVTIVALLTALPRPVVTAIAGLALAGTIAHCLAGGFGEPDTRDASLWAFLVTAADVAFLGVGSAFWGFVAGVAVHLLLERRRAA